MPSKVIAYMISVLFLLPLISCDPAQSIRFENTTDAPATIELIFNNDKHYYQFEDQRKGDTLNITLNPENPVREFHFGIGHWKVQNSLDSLVAMVESIKITTKYSTQTFKGKDQIQAFFEEKLSGRQDETIMISLQ
jgi:hypothetical protein